MNWSRNNGVPAFLAVAALSAAEILRLSNVVPVRLWGETEIICNVVMLLIAAIGFFAQRRRSEAEKDTSAAGVAGNLAVPLTALIMNVDVFGHTIRRERLLSDLWGWHLFWICFAALQILLLSPLGKLLLAQLSGLFKWGKRIMATLGGTVSDALDFIKARSKEMLLTVTLGIILWALWLAIRVSGEDTLTLFADIGFWMENLMCWGAYLLVVLFIRLFPAITQKTRGALADLDGKYILVIIALAVMLTVSVLAELPVLKAVSIALAVLGLIFSALKWAAKRDERLADKLKQFTKGGIRRKDILVLLLFFAVLPLTIIFMILPSTPAGRRLFSEGISDPASLLNLWSASLEVVNGFLQLFRFS